MAIKNVFPLLVGQAGSKPNQWKIETDDNLDTVLGTGYLSTFGSNFGYSFCPGDQALVTMIINNVICSGIFQISIANNQVSLVDTSNNIPSSYGTIGFILGAGVTFTMTVPSTVYPVTGLSTSFSLATNSANFAMTTDGRLKYTGSSNITVMAQYSISFESANADNSCLFGLTKNGVLNDFSKNSALGLTTPKNVTCVPVAFDLVTNDYISLTGQAFGTGSTAITIIEVNISCWKV